MGFIYKITNTINGKAYVGQTSQKIRVRWITHKCNAHQEKYKHIPLYRAFNKYGVENFVFEILEECDNKFLNEREMYYIGLYDTFRNGYNCTYGGEGIRGFCHTQETKEKVRKNSIERDAAKPLRVYTKSLKGKKLTGDRLLHARQNIKKANVAASAWHKSPEGHKWHIEQGKKFQGKCFAQTFQHTCPICGAEYTTHRKYSPACSGKCKQKQRRIQKLNKIPGICSCCGKEILVPKYSKKKFHFCSLSCAGRWRAFAKKLNSVPATQVVAIEPCGNADVYNMEVEHTHSFSVQGGLIVHNCLDALRYSCCKLNQQNFSF